MATGILVGTTTDGVNTINANVFRLAKYTALATGAVSEIKVYSSASGNVKVAIYADDGGEPGNLITANNTPQAVTGGQWNTVSIGNTSIVKDTVYWLAVNTDTTGAANRLGASSGDARMKTGQTFGTFEFPDPAGTGFSTATTSLAIAGWGVLLLAPSGIEQATAPGQPTLQLAGGLTIQPSGVEQLIAIGSPTLVYPQTISPSGISVSISVGEPAVSLAGAAQTIKPSGIAVITAIGSLTLLKYIWHVILDSQYAVETPEVNRVYIIGRDASGNHVYGAAVDSTELGLVGERLDFRQDLSIPTEAKAGDVASAVLAKMRLRGRRGFILIPPNCGQELWDVVQVTDSPGNQSSQKFRVVGIRFEYSPGEARYHHRLILGAP